MNRTAQTVTEAIPLPRLRIAVIVIAVSLSLVPEITLAAGGSVTVSVRDEKTEKGVATRLELYRGSLEGKPMPVRKTVPAGFGVVLDRSLELSLPDGPYAFRMIRGPEYRIMSGTFVLERTSLDEHSVALPRMVDMYQIGWTSGDCFVPATNADLPIRMASEDLHVAAVAGKMETAPVPTSPAKDPLEFEPVWYNHHVVHFGGLAFYGTDDASLPQSDVPVDELAGIDESIRVAVENPFAWELPTWLASGKVSGIFLFGDWLRLDRTVLKPSDGRESKEASFNDEKSLGRYAESIYWNLLEAGFKLPPLAGSGSEGQTTPVGYNRLYVAQQLDGYDSYSPSRPNEFPLEAKSVQSIDEWWQAAWAGQSIATNGPLLRPKLGGQIPGHTFTATTGDKLELAVDLTLSVRDPVDYLEVVHNGRVHYSARLDEFALAGGRIPSLEITESGWVLVRVVTGYEKHFRAAISAPWYIEFDGQPRVTKTSIDFFQRWQKEYEQRLIERSPESIQKLAPAIRTTRAFWQERATLAK